MPTHSYLIFSSQTYSDQPTTLLEKPLDKGIEDELTDMGHQECSSTMNYSAWLQQWHQPSHPLTINIPQKACAIVIPLQQEIWSKYLAKHPNRELVKFFLQGLSEGFWIDFDNSSIKLKSAKSNLQSAQLHPDVVDKYLQSEIAFTRVGGHTQWSHLQIRDHPQKTPGK